MKKIINKINFAVVAIMASLPAFAGDPLEEGSDLCNLINKLKEVFVVLRTMAFIGAAFIIANWAWGYINAGKDGGVSLDDIKKKGTNLLVGFGLLFMIGLILTFISSAFGIKSLGCLKNF